MPTTKLSNEFVTQAPEAIYTGSEPKAGIVYGNAPSAAFGRTVTQFCMPTGERMKNGKYVVLFIDIMDRGQSRTYMVKTMGMDDVWFRAWKRLEQVPARVYASLQAAREGK